MKIKKLVIFLLVGLSMAFSIYLNNYYDRYNIDNSIENVQNKLTDFNVSIDSESIKKIHVWEQIDNTNTWVAYLEFEENNYGYAHLKQGWNKKLRLISIGTKTDITYRELETNKGNYGVVIGENINRDISKIKVTTENKQHEFLIDISNESHFIKYEKLPKNTTNSFPAQFTLYDYSNNVIE